MITVNDFAEAISEYFDEGERTVPEYRGKTEAQVMFELAKRMAIDFIAWIAINEYHVVLTERGGKYWTKGFHGARISNEQLFELYQQQKQ